MGTHLNCWKIHLHSSIGKDGVSISDTSIFHPRTCMFDFENARVWDENSDGVVKRDTKSGMPSKHCSAEKKTNRRLRRCFSARGAGKGYEAVARRYCGGAREQSEGAFEMPPAFNCPERDMGSFRCCASRQICLWVAVIALRSCCASAFGSLGR